MTQTIEELDLDIDIDASIKCSYKGSCENDADVMIVSRCCKHKAMACAPHLIEWKEYMANVFWQAMIHARDVRCSKCNSQLEERCYDIYPL